MAGEAPPTSPQLLPTTTMGGETVVKLEESQTFWVNTSLLGILALANLTTLVLLTCRKSFRKNQGALNLLQLITIGDLVCGTSLSIFLFVFNFLSPEGAPEIMCTRDYTFHAGFKVMAVLLGVALARQLHVVTIFGRNSGPMYKLFIPFVLVVLIIFLPDMFAYIPNNRFSGNRVEHPYVLCLKSHKMPPLSVAMTIALGLVVCFTVIQLVSSCMCKNRRKYENRDVFYTLSSTEVITDKTKLLSSEKLNENDKNHKMLWEFTSTPDQPEEYWKFKSSTNVIKTSCLVVLNLMLLFLPLVFAMTFYNVHVGDGSRTESYLNPLVKWAILSVFNTLSSLYYERFIAGDKRTIQL